MHAASMYSGKAETLVIYTFSNTDPEYERNLRFLVQYGMWEGDGCEYLIIIQQVRLACMLNKILPED